MQGDIRYDIAFGPRNATLSHLDWLHEHISEVIERFAPAFSSDPTEEGERPHCRSYRAAPATPSVRQFGPFARRIPENR
jgi:hypothetical protein